MNLGERATAATEVCDVCHAKVRQRYPLTRYDGKHFRPVRVCITCLGPDRDYDITGLPQKRVLTEMLDLKRLKRR